MQTPGYRSVQIRVQPMGFSSWIETQGYNY